MRQIPFIIFELIRLRNEYRRACAAGPAELRKFWRGVYCFLTWLVGIAPIAFWAHHRYNLSYAHHDDPMLIIVPMTWIVGVPIVAGVAALVYQLIHRTGANSADRPRDVDEPLEVCERRALESWAARNFKRPGA